MEELSHEASLRRRLSRRGPTPSPVKTSAPCWFVVATSSSTIGTPSTTSTLATVALEVSVSPGQTWAVKRPPKAHEPSITHVVGEHAAGHPHRQHPVREDARVARDLGREHLVGVQRVVVARGARVLDDLGAGQVLDDHGLVHVADRECSARSGGLTSTPSGPCARRRTRATTTSSPSSSRYSVIASRNCRRPPRRPCFSQLSPVRAVIVSTSPGRTGRWYS